jgi:hypothetical protein
MVRRKMRKNKRTVVNKIPQRNSKVSAETIISDAFSYSEKCIKIRKSRKMSKIFFYQCVT